MSADCCVVDLSSDKMRLFSRRPSPRLLAAPILLLALFSLVGLTDWIDWNTSKNCPVKPSRQDNWTREIGRRSADLRAASDQAYARSLNEPSFSQGKCRNLAPSQADIDTLDVYPTLNFQVGHIDWLQASKEKKNGWKNSLYSYQTPLIF